MTPNLTASQTRSVTGDWRKRLDLVVETMREMSRQTDPQAMVRAYGLRVRQVLPVDRSVSLSRRDLTPPHYRITRSSLWKDEVNPWKHPERLPLLDRGLLGELLYGDQPRIIDDLHVSPDDPAAEYFAGQGSLIAIPLYDKGVALNMVVLMRRERAGFDREHFPEWVWLSNLFGQAAHNLVLSEKLQRAYTAVDEEMKVIAEIQRSLLPRELPRIPTMQLAVHYQTSRRAGGDYYDFFPLPGGRWGILIADVSGHGTPAAVLMAITHSIAHVLPGEPTPPSRLLDHINHHLATRYTEGGGSFVTAFYGIYDPESRKLTYACAGHNPPRLRRCGDRSFTSLCGAMNLPLGVFATERYRDAEVALRPHDLLVFFTDGITEAANPAGEMFGVGRLDRILATCPERAEELLASVLTSLDQFTEGRPPADDRTLLVAKVD